ncbi:hypothetical protein KHC33_09180 [Methanospirillum sp. J.3.6.1-F.2.7.3]|uniref:Uncharacterized protein n=1 Tax=Methanospirillum purgamenti TaxID=2834276 RepID=A0A8E7AUK1_9EURY|nr:MULTISPECIES: hypothetical protein [Methanospirillum]MDX8550964.1 hypothetical protein [Methanospirillum hungatei]QVV87545.1 hypothetical protein KHC33_09180 [Methanospirillum sp. J.3.6.1-F.2.7.3]
MEKRDIIVILAAIIVVFIMAVVVKPVITGQPVIFLPESPPVTESSDYEIYPETPYTIAPVDTEVVLTPEQTQIPEETQPISTATNVQAPTPTLTPMTWQPNPDDPMPAIQMTNYAEIIGKYTGSTSPFRIPTPYWELHYNVTPADMSASFSIDVIEKSEKEEKTIRTISWRDGKEPDPREFRFFEGGKEYYISILANQLKEYRIIIQIPLKYIRDT